jgi:5-methylcytosine-specific restriction enzyme A
MRRLLYRRARILEGVYLGMGSIGDPCELCGRATVPLTKHHLVPKARHNRKVRRDLGADRNKVAMICRPCQDQIHDLFTEKQLEREYNTIELLRANEDVKEWITWVQRRPTWGL